MRFNILYVLIVLCMVFMTINADTSGLYGETSPRDYLSGRFDPAKHGLFIDCSKLGIPTNGRTHYLRKETAAAFKKLVTAFKEDHPDIRMYLTSSTRNYWYQKSIWEAKYNGKRLVDGQKLNKSEPDTYKRTLKILQYSSMPGTSRHHWGTDLDINRLVNSYYSSGEGKIIFDWMKENASRYGFYQVYTAGRNGGYNEERWHWSYLPVSRLLLREWVRYFKDSTAYFSANDAFDGSEYADRLALHYVTEINPVCKK